MIDNDYDWEDEQDLYSLLTGIAETDDGEGWPERTSDLAYIDRLSRQQVENGRVYGVPDIHLISDEFETPAKSRVYIDREVEWQPNDQEKIDCAASGQAQRVTGGTCYFIQRVSA